MNFHMPLEILKLRTFTYTYTLLRRTPHTFANDVVLLVSTTLALNRQLDACENTGGNATVILRGHQPTVKSFGHKSQNPVPGLSPNFPDGL